VCRPLFQELFLPGTEEWFCVPLLPPVSSAPGRAGQDPDTCCLPSPTELPLHRQPLPRWCCYHGAGWDGQVLERQCEASSSGQPLSLHIQALLNLAWIPPNVLNVSFYLSDAICSLLIVVCHIIHFSKMLQTSNSSNMNAGTSLIHRGWVPEPSLVLKSLT
jgi:hypothetical protein